MMSTTKSLFAATALALGLCLAAPVPSALACGGYGSFDPERVEVERAIADHLERGAPGRAHWIETLTVDRGVAHARVQVATEGGYEARELTLALHRGGWVLVDDGAA